MSMVSISLTLLYAARTMVQVPWAVLRRLLTSRNKMATENHPKTEEIKYVPEQLHFHVIRVVEIFLAFFIITSFF